MGWTVLKYALFVVGILLIVAGVLALSFILLPGMGYRWRSFWQWRNDKIGPAIVSVRSLLSERIDPSWKC